MYQLNCKTCNLIIGKFDLDHLETLESLAMMIHAGGPHAGCHHLEILIDDKPIPEGEVEVKITCLQANCTSFEKPETYRVPTWAVGATVLSFHSRMEGHPLRVAINGKEITPLIDC